MAEFEELKLTVNLVDNASAGLVNIRAQITGLTQSATQMGQAFAGATAQVQQLGNAATQAHPRVGALSDQFKGFGKSLEETTRGFAQMALSIRGGVGSFPQLALGLREAMTGLQGMNLAANALGTASSAAIVGLAGIATGVVAVGAAVAAYGVSVFKFSQEMFTLSQTSKALGVSFGTLKNLTEQNELFGISVETTVGQLQTMQSTLADLSVSGSKLRQQMIGMGVPPQRIDEIVHETDAIKRRNMVIQDQLKIEPDLQKRMGKEAAAEWTNRYGAWFGVDPQARTRPLETPQTQEQKDADERLAEQSGRIADEWRKAEKVMRDTTNSIKEWGTEFLDNELKRLRGGTDATPSTPPAATPPSYGLGVGPNAAGSVSGYHPTSFTTGGANVNSLLHPASFRPDVSDGFSGTSSEGRAQAIIKGGVYDALVEFYGFLQSGGTAGGGKGGIQNASLTTGNVLSGGVGDSFVKGGGSVTYGRHGGGGGDGGPGGDGSTAPPSGNLAAQRAGFQKELESDPQLKAFAVDAMQHEGGIQSNMEQLFNYAAMRHMTIRQALHSGQYGPVNRGMISGNISAKTRAQGEEALQKVYAGSNITDYATDQGMQGDPNFAKYMSNPSYWGMHKVQGAWFSSHGEKGRRWAEQQRAADAKSAADSQKSKSVSASGRVSLEDAAASGGGMAAGAGGGAAGGPAETGEREPTRVYINKGSPPAELGPQSMLDLDRQSMSLDRAALSRSQEITSKGALSVDVNAPPGTKVAYNGSNLLKNTSMQRQTQMLPTIGGPTVGDPADSYMRGAA